MLSRFTPEERRRIGVHTCPGGDQDSTHSADVDYAELLPELFALEVGNVYLQMASEPDRQRIPTLIHEHARPDQVIFVGVTDPIDPLAGARYLSGGCRARPTPANTSDMLPGP